MSKLAKGRIAWGADPEFFAGYIGPDGELNVLPPVVLRSEGYPVTMESEEKDPEQRHPVFQFYGDSKVHEDGAAFEMSVPPSNNWKDLWNTINQVKEDFGKDVLSNYPGICHPVLYALPTMNWQVDRWLHCGKDFRLATRFGCDPDMSALNLEIPCMETDASLHPERYAGGHIHISGIPEIKEFPLPTIWSMILSAGLAAVGYSDVPELEKRRTFLYGRPDKFRNQWYPDGSVGVEYRTPSTRWTSSLDLAEKVFGWATIGIECLLQGKLIFELKEKLMDDAKTIITSVDQDGAKSMLNYISTRL